MRKYGIEPDTSGKVGMAWEGRRIKGFGIFGGAGAAVGVLTDFEKNFRRRGLAWVGNSF